MLREDGVLIPTTHVESVLPPSAQAAAEKSKQYVRRHWKFYPSGTETAADEAPPKDLFERILSHSLCISGMAFQDAWNIDLERLQRCCIHVVTEQQRMIPFCAYYLTDSSGRRLHSPAGRSDRCGQRSADSIDSGF